MLSGGSRSGAVGKIASLAVAGAVLIAGASLWSDRPVKAADHLDPPSRTNIGTMSDAAGDIADVFIWNDATTVTLAVTGAGPKEAGLAPVYDRDVLTRVHLSSDGDPTTDEAVIDVRYGKDAAGNWGVQFLGVPGASVEGPVQTQLANGSVVKAEAGLFDDPFFFDLQGFNDTKATGILSITNSRNFFAGKNDTSFVVQFPRASLEQAGHPISVWAETRRISGS